MNVPANRSVGKYVKWQCSIEIPTLLSESVLIRLQGAALCDFERYTQVTHIEEDSKLQARFVAWKINGCSVTSKCFGRGCLRCYPVTAANAFKAKSPVAPAVCSLRKHSLQTRGKCYFSEFYRSDKTFTILNQTFCVNFSIY